MKKTKKDLILYWILSTTYNLTWVFVLPFLFCSKRIRSGISKRISNPKSFRKVDVWIQAASGGEASLAKEILQAWPKSKSVNVLVTTNTPQGMEILSSYTKENKHHSNIITDYYPLDTTWFLQKTLRNYKPELIVLLESELWPGLLMASKKNQIPVLLVNARMSSKSLARYLPLSKFWSKFAPDEIYAVSPTDKQRFSLVFEKNNIGLMPNIKFDRCNLNSAIPYVQNPLSKIIKANSQFIVFGSIRTQEEKPLIQAINKITNSKPRAILGIFPRHMHRIPAWKQMLSDYGLSWILRSEIEDRVPSGKIILWDTFGELEQAYALARAVYVGGSLAPLGGQNLLEPLAQGVIPCIGPHWYNFSWIGEEIIQNGLVNQVYNSEELLDCLLSSIKTTHSRDKVRSHFLKYLKEHHGGTEFVIQKIISYLNSK